MNKLLDLFRIKNKKPYTAADVYHSTGVKRGQQTNVGRQQTIAEHSFTVTMIGRMILDVVNPNATCEDKLLLNDLCLWHDMPETATGDPSTPIKRIIESMFSELAGEKASPFELIENEICPQYAELNHKTKGTYLERIKKLADILDAAKYISIEGKGAQRHKIHLERIEAFRTLIDIAAKEFPDYDWSAAYQIKSDLMDGEPASLDFVETF